MRRALLLVVAACFPTPADYVGKQCDDQHPCGGTLYCVEGRCAVEPPATGTGGGGGAVVIGPAGGSTGAGGGVMSGSGGGTGGGSSGGGSGGGAPAAPSCDAGVAEDCTNGKDDDCDGLVDCADPFCATRACDAANPGAVCCGTTCRDLSADTNNCGGCGTQCGTGQTCMAIATGPVVTGRCSCSNMGPSSCPTPNGNDQSCVFNRCSCDDDDECAAGQRCRRLGGGGSSPGVCHY